MILTRFRTRLFRRPRPAPPVKAATINLDDPAIAGDPFPHYEALRAAGPVQFLARHDAWIVIGHEELQTVCTRPDLFSNRPNEDWDTVLAAADPPDHTMIRRLVAPYFGREAVERLAAFSAERAAALLRPRLDVVDDYAQPLSQAVTQRLIGCDAATVNAIRAAGDEPASLMAALNELADRADLYGHLRADGLDETQARSLVRLFWIASTQTTERAIAETIVQLLRDPRTREAVTSDDALVGPYIDEVMRLQPAEPMLRRRALQSVSLGGATIPAGSAVLLCLAAANRDPHIYDSPAEFQLGRAHQRHLAFGHGIHHCIGATLGRAEVAAALRALLRHAPRFRAAQPVERAPYVATMMARHVAHFFIDTGLEASGGPR